MRKLSINDVRELPGDAGFLIDDAPLPFYTIQDLLSQGKNLHNG